MSNQLLAAILKSKLLFCGFHILLKIAKSMEEKVRLQKGNTAIIDLQEKLISLVQKLFRSREICFTAVPAVGNKGGNNWKSVSKLEGLWVYQKFQDDPEFAIETSRCVARDYQRVIAQTKTEGVSSRKIDVEEGKKWVFGSLLKWSGPIVEAGYLNHKQVAELTKDFEEAIEQKGDEFFGYAHGNIIGDHILIGNDGTIYLFGMRIVLRPGKGYYDFLRALDWFLLNTPSDEKTFELFTVWMKSSLKEEGWEEVKLVFALRCIGILGWDILHRGDEGEGEFAQKREALLRFIDRKY